MSTAFAWRCAEFGAELDAWMGLTGDGQPLTKHRSQIAALHRLVGGAASRLADEARNGTRPFGELLRDEVDLWRIWSVFQGPLLQRRHPRHADTLSFADGFAWSCYRPAAACVRDAAQQARVLEPPLVFCEPAEQPTALVRGRSFAAAAAASDASLWDRLPQIVLHLPVPLVTVPWGCLGYLPDLLLIAHEVGHLADGDFDIYAAVRQALPDLLAADSPWLGCLGEVVADIYGALAAGVPFARTLGRCLAFHAAAEAAGAPPAAGYPPVALRLLSTCCALRFQGLDVGDLHAEALAPVSQADATAIQAITAAVCHTGLPRLGETSLMQAFANPAPVNGGYGDVLDPNELLVQTNTDASRLQDGQAPLSADLRALLGALAQVAAGEARNIDLAWASRQAVVRAVAIRPDTVLGAPSGQQPDGFAAADFDLLSALHKARNQASAASHSK